MLKLLSILALALLATQETPLTVDQILDRVEKVNITSATGSVTYVKTDPILDRKEIRSGELLYRVCVGHKEAAIMFDTLVIGRRKEVRNKRYIFSGRWFVEIDPDKKQFIKRELISPEDAKEIDPFALGNGPIPLPIAQTKASVLSKFDVTLIQKPTEGLLSSLPSTIVGLQLTPKGKSEWTSIDLYYDTTSWFPVGVRTLEKDGTVRMSRLQDVKMNALTEAQEQLLNIDTPNPKEWSIDIQPFVKD